MKGGTTGIKSFRLQDEEFEKAIQLIVPKFIKLLKGLGVPDPGNYIYIDYYRKQIILFVPLKNGLVYPIVIDVTSRTWYTPKSRFYDPVRERGIFFSMVRGFFSVLRKRGFKIKERMIRDRTFIALIKNATRSVKGLIRKTYNGISVGVLVVKKYEDVTEALKRAFNFVYNYVSRRYQRLKQVLKEKGVTPFGEVEKLLVNLEILKNWLALTWLDRVR